jgi:structure-specific endonuclease subunit SLX1
MSMQDKLANLHILLRANSFERWPLKVRFFAEDVHKMWHRWTVNMPEVVRHGIEIEMDESILDKASLEDDPLQPVGIYLIDPTYQHMKTTLEKSTKLLDAPQNSCAICSTLFDSTKVMALVCSNSECDASFHVACLSHQFLKGENALAAVVPTQGDCPTCRSSLNWSDLVKDLSLRIRGEKEVAALFKVPKRRKGGSKEEVIVPVVEEDEDEDMEEPSAVADESEADVDYDDVLVQSDYEDIDRVQATPSGGDGWKLIDDMDEQGLPGAVVAAMSLAGKGRREFVEDSDWDEAEVIE